MMVSLNRFCVALLKKLTEKGTGNLLLSAKLRCCDLLAGRFAHLAPWFCLDRSKTGDPAKSLVHLKTYPIRLPDALPSVPRLAVAVITSSSDADHQSLHVSQLG